MMNINQKISELELQVAELRERLSSVMQELKQNRKEIKVNGLSVSELDCALHSEFGPFIQHLKKNKRFQ